MPATALVLPPQQVPVIDTGGLVSLPWRSSLQNALNNLQAQITALAALEGDTTALDAALAVLQGELDAAEASIAAHIANTSNPHATTAAQVGADPVGTAAAAVAAHVALADPHTQYLTAAEGNAAYDAIGAAAAAQAASQPLDATLTALAGANWALNALPIGTGPDTVSQVAFAANTFPARASTGNLEAKTITAGALSALAGSGGAAGFLSGDGTISNTLTSDFTVDAGTLKVDSTNNRVGVNTNTPQRPFHSVGLQGVVPSFPASIGPNIPMLLENNGNSVIALLGSTSGACGLAAYESGGSSVTAFSYYLTADNSYRWEAEGAARFTLHEIMTEFWGKPFGIGGTSFGSGDGAMLFIANATTVPTTNPTGGGILYVEAGSLKFRGSSGTVTTIAPA